MNHGMRYFDAGWESIEDNAPSFLLEDLNEFPVRGEVVFITKDRCSEMAGERMSSAEIVVGGVAVDQQRIGSKNLIGEFGLADELLETDGEEFCLCVERDRALLSP